MMKGEVFFIDPHFMKLDQMMINTLQDPNYCDYLDLASPFALVETCNPRDQLPKAFNQIRNLFF